MNNPNQKRKKHLNQQQLWQIWENEEMIWKGRPNPDIGGWQVDKMKEKPAQKTIWSERAKLILFILIIVIGIHIPYLLVSGLFIFIACIAGVEFYRGVRLEVTEYAFNKKGIFFKLWRWGDTRIHFIGFEDIERIDVELCSNEHGVLSFVLSTKCYFKTQDFFRDAQRKHPTFELVANALQLKERMDDLRIMRMKAIVDSSNYIVQ